MPLEQERSLVCMAMPPDGPPLALLRARIRASLPALTHQTVSDVQLTATELVTNAYEHGRPPVEFHLFHSADGRLRLEVSDNGSVLPRVKHPDITTAGGRGLLLVESVSDNWGVTPSTSGKTVWAEFPAVTG
jgi:anti-sigma regulatory factor (Ser/Thr protein kinase)